MVVDIVPGVDWREESRMPSVTLSQWDLESF